MTYIECFKNQQWNVEHDSSNPTFFEGVERTVTDSGFLIPAAIAFPAALVFPLIVLFHEIFGAVGDRRRRRREAALRKIDQEQTRRELVKAYAEGTIDDLAFQTKMDDLYAKGVQPAKD